MLDEGDIVEKTATGIHFCKGNCNGCSVESEPRCLGAKPQFHSIIKVGAAQSTTSAEERTLLFFNNRKTPKAFTEHTNHSSISCTSKNIFYRYRVHQMTSTRANQWLGVVTCNVNAQVA